MCHDQSGDEEEQEERMRKLQLNTRHLLKEAREKSRGWEGHPAPEHVELAFKKVKEGRFNSNQSVRAQIICGVEGAAQHGNTL